MSFKFECVIGGDAGARENVHTVEDICAALGMVIAELMRKGVRDSKADENNIFIKPQFSAENPETVYAGWYSFKEEP